jgi:L-aspartate oxidase
MWANAGIVRNGEGLESALERINELARKLRASAGGGISADAIETKNMLLVSKLIARAALRREESRGGHYRSDYPEKAKEWEKHIILSKPLKKI